MPKKLSPAKHQRSSFWYASLALYVFASAYAVYLGVTKPVYNWDMIGYVGSVLASESNDAQQIHNQALEEVTAVTPEMFHATFLNNPLSNNTGNFIRQIPFYDIKPLYVTAVTMLHQLGASLAEATWLVSAFFFIILAVAIGLWRPTKAPHGVWLLAVIALMWLGNLPMQRLAGYSTPDAMAIAFLMVGFMAWWRNRSLAGFTIACLLAIFTRPDALITVLALTLFFTLFARKERLLSMPHGVAIGVTMIGAYLALQNILGSVGWETLFYRGFINDNFDFTKATVTITWEQYWRALAWGLEHIISNPRILALTALSTVALFCHYHHRQKEWLWFLLMGWGTFAVRFALFPNWGDERYHFFSYLLIMMASIELIAPLFTSYKLVKK